MKITKLLLIFLFAGLSLISLPVFQRAPAHFEATNSTNALPLTKTSLQDSPALERISFNSDVPYFYVGSALAADADSGHIAISSFDKKITILSIKNMDVANEISSVDSPNSLFYYNETVISLQGEKIILNSQYHSSELSGFFIAIYVEKTSNQLLAIDQSFKFMVFDLNPILSSSALILDESQFLLNSFDLSNYLNNSTLSGAITGFTADADFAYLALPNAVNKNLDDIFKLNLQSGAMQIMHERVARVSAIEKNANLFFILIRGEVFCYEVFDGKLSLLHSNFFNATTLTIYDSKLFMLTEEDAMITTDFTLTNTSTIFSSQSNMEGFFAFPSYAYTRRGNLFVADTLNNRLFIAENEENKFANDFERINSVVSDSFGNIYVSFGINKVAVLNSSLKTTDIFFLTHSVEKLIIDTNNNILVLSNNKLLLFGENGILTPLEHLPNAADATFLMGSNALYIYDGTFIYKNQSPLDPQCISTQLFAKSDIVSFSADLAGNIFLFDTNGNLFRYDAVTEELTQINLATNGLDLAFAVNISISNIQSDKLNYGDLIFTISQKHCIYRISRDSINISVTDSNHLSPDISEPLPIDSTLPMVFRLKMKAELFPAPIEVGSTFIIPANERVFYYSNYNSIDEYAFVIYEDILNKKLISGYVFRNLVDFSTYSYSSAPNANAIIFFNATPIYKFPSLHSAKLAQFDKGESLELIDFAAPNAANGYSSGNYIDNYGRMWYRVKINDLIGFCPADNISLNQYVPQLRPKPNATIKAADGVKFASLYKFNETTKTFEIIDGEFPLPEGTRVELTKTPLDTQSEFSEIKFYRDGLGTLICYVKTAHIEYDSVSNIQIVAIIALSIIVITTLLLLVFISRHKKQKLLES